ncbi:sulfatase-like hydrolase/transferase [Polaribacter pectinis]|uniref:Sulfatase-like hydrolase/transferase n=1 Tax=Polaribacter pectinis TaxID=2738844 RepID=A0A7G9L6R8_9FLAO|nr:sulfatase-like hydrolase/transferase [Polaribacter pectinis]QNM84317.1 sulfatase-like hydrolase/transferase [Polaribacter pectinis]
MKNKLTIFLLLTFVSISFQYLVWNCNIGDNFFNEGNWQKKITGFALHISANNKTKDLINPPSQPNIIVIMADDLGYNDVSFNGSQQIPTPNIDRIANEGVKCTNGYVSYSVCGPSRAGFLTGRYQQRFGFERNPQYDPSDPNMGLAHDESTIANNLGSVGYKTGIIGKWHLGANIKNHPLNRGFDEFFGHLGGGHQYFSNMWTIEDSYAINSESKSYRTWLMRDHKPVNPITTPKYITEEFADESVAFVERHKDSPFFLFLSYNAPHGPLQATQKYLDRFPNIKSKKRRTYAAMVSALDDGVGLLMDKLEELNLDENTLVFFLSDNGGPEDKNASDNGLLREGKSSVYEGGYHVPFAIRWKGTVKQGVYDKPVSSLDIMATAVALANAKTNPEKPLDGVNLIPYITGEKLGKPHETIYLRKFDQDRFAVRYNDYKLVVIKGEKELYNLEKDLSETTNIAKQHIDQVEKIDALRKSWNEELIDPVFKGLVHRKKRINKNGN